MKKIVMVAALSAVVFGALGSSSFAATKTDTFNVQIIIRGTCFITTGASDIDLGTVDANEVDTSNSGTMSVKCSRNLPYSVGMTPSNANTGGAGTMAAQTPPNADAVPYQLYSDAGYSTAWGNIIGTNTVAGIGDGIGLPVTADLYTIYARAASADYAADTYIDVVTATVTY